VLFCDRVYNVEGFALAVGDLRGGGRAREGFRAEEGAARVVDHYFGVVVEEDRTLMEIWSRKFTI
jgi:hypothetical protein